MFAEDLQIFPSPDYSHIQLIAGHLHLHVPHLELKVCPNLNSPPLHCFPCNFFIYQARNLGINFDFHFLASNQQLLPTSSSVVCSILSTLASALIQACSMSYSGHYDSFIPGLHAAYVNSCIPHPFSTYPPAGDLAVLPLQPYV